MILVDIAEPEEIVALLEQTGEVIVTPLNQSSRGDYYFAGEDGRIRQFCRVQAGELLGNIDSQEDELRRYYNEADDNYLIIEGLISDTPLTRTDKATQKQHDVSIYVKQPRPGILYAHRVAANGYVMKPHSFDIGADLLYAWLFRLAECGVQTFYTTNYVGTAKCIASIYRNCQKDPDSHTTMNRYYIPRISLGEKDEDTKKRVTIREQNPFIRSMMALSLINGLDIGEKKASAMYKHGYRTLLDIAYAEVDELVRVEGIGKKTAQRLLQVFGREE